MRKECCDLMCGRSAGDFRWNSANIANCLLAKRPARIRRLLGSIAVLAVASLGFSAQGAVKKVPYPEVKVTVNQAYQPDPTFEKMRRAFAEAVATKDAAALAQLVAPMFLWTLGGQPSDQLDLGRDALANFKVAFGFRAPGMDEDGGVENGPFWDPLAAFSSDVSYYRANDSGSLVCVPIAAEVVDDNIYEQARKKVAS